MLNLDGRDFEALGLKSLNLSANVIGFLSLQAPLGNDASLRTDGRVESRNSHSDFSRVSR
jgi:hypothetical protein